MTAQVSVSASGLGRALSASLARARVETMPYRHWPLEDVLPRSVCRAIDALPFAAPEIDDTAGRRETHNSTRRFFGVAECGAHEVCRSLTAAFQGLEVTGAIQAVCGISLGGSYLRVEYCQDRDGFWLEPHTDIGAKLFTLLIYLSGDEGAESWGTDLYDGPETWVGRAPFGRNRGLMFVPAADTWHGFRKRPISGLRRSLIVNYVKDEWRSRHELAFPESPVGG